ncbi:GNAT family N-acetyltransferase [Pseudodesulfovibrio portus]|uniref:N-acetyltransferase n=1 Tax=Pseudodesulfovibrio portus TaxID=231439 RepID=A0ABN6RZS2_9BACT|nr:GNAT family protein [Pseudodesulfovibrio portus]BDQ35137.1 N-acetyltransferase [Pseudodesulfovibrio portus]
MTDFITTELHTARCLLRPWRTEDIPLVPPIADTRAISWNTSLKFPHPYGEEAARTMVSWSQADAGVDKWQFAVFKDGQLIGGCGTIRGEDVHAHTAVVGYWLGVDWWGRGIASEILAALVDYMREETDIEQLTATCFGWNPASRRVLEKAGFRNEGVRKGVVKKWGKTTDLWVYGMLL